MPSPAPVLAIVGPTASGKTGLAVETAARLGIPVEIVSCDAYQVYRELDIGSGKPTSEELRAVPHHLISILRPDDPATAGRYAWLAAEAVGAIRARGGVPLVVGGSGLYFRALREGVFDGPEIAPGLRARLRRLDRRPRGRVRLDLLLDRLDPAAHRRIHPNDRVRRLRALEVALAGGAPITALRSRRRPPLGASPWSVLALDPPRELLGDRIAARVRGMFAAGLADEARRLLERYGERWPGRVAIGYREILAAFAASADGVLPEGVLAEVEAGVIASTRRYARRQLTWFRAESGLTWVRAAGGDARALAAAEDLFAAALGVRPQVCRPPSDPPGSAP